MRDLYYKWVEGKEKDFKELQKVVNAKIDEKDTNDALIAELRQEKNVLTVSANELS